MKTFGNPFRTALAILCLLGGDLARAAEADPETPADNSLRDFMVGQYDLIGRKPDSTATYSGRVQLRAQGNTLEVTRTIAGKTEKGTVHFVTVAGADRIPVVRMQFRFGGVAYEATYRWQSDPDNFPRFTGLVYRPDSRTKSPGIEALFPIQK